MSQTGSVVLCCDLGIVRWPLIFVDCGEGSAIHAWETELVILSPHVIIALGRLIRTGFD